MMGAFRHAASHTQARARHASLIAPAAWRGLFDESTAAGVAARLASQMTYGADLPSDPVALERRLKERLASETASLASLQWGTPRRLLTAYARRFELANLKTLLRARYYGVSSERCEAVLVPLTRTVLRWQALLEAPSSQAVAELLGGTPYARPILAVLDQQGEAPPFPFEIALDLAYFQTLVRRTLQLSGSDGRRARRFIGDWIALENLSWAFRYRRLAGLTPEETVNYTLHRAFGAGLAAVRRVVTGSSVADEAARLGYAIDTGLAEDEALAALERAGLRRRAEDAARIFEGVAIDLGAVLALLVLREAEVHDLVTLVESRAAGLSHEALTTRLLSPVSRAEA